MDRLGGPVFSAYWATSESRDWRGGGRIIGGQAVPDTGPAWWLGRLQHYCPTGSHTGSHTFRIVIERLLLLGERKDPPHFQAMLSSLPQHVIWSFLRRGWLLIDFTSAFAAPHPISGSGLSQWGDSRLQLCAKCYVYHFLQDEMAKIIVMFTQIWSSMVYVLHLILIKTITFYVSFDFYGSLINEISDIAVMFPLRFSWTIERSVWLQNTALCARVCVCVFNALEKIKNLSFILLLNYEGKRGNNTKGGCSQSKETGLRKLGRKTEGKPWEGKKNSLKLIRRGGERGRWSLSWELQVSLESTPAASGSAVVAAAAALRGIDCGDRCRKL